MIRRIFAVAILAAFIFSCNNGESKTDKLIKREISDGAKDEQNTEQHTELLYLDTAENIYNILCQDWVLKDDADGLEGVAESSEVEVPYRSFYFSTKGTFVKNPRNTFDYGNWVYDDAAKTITLNNTIDKTRDIYKIARVGYDELVLVNVGANSTTNLTFVAPGKRYKNPADEPYLLENNRWRIKPKTKETPAEIKQRLKDNIRFFILFYKSALAKKDAQVSFWGLPSCFKWYGGGIFIKKEKELKENWVSCFYDKDQAMQAYALADKLLSQKYEWPKGESNWIKLNLAVSELMYKKIDEIQ